MNGNGLLIDVLRTVFPYVVAGALVMARMLGTALVFPIFTRMGLTGLIRSGIALALALPLIPYVAEQVAAAEGMSAARLVALLLKEAFVGLMLGIVFGIPFWGAEAAGDVLDFQRGSSAASLIDPSATSESSVTATLFVMTLIAIFFMTGAFRILVEGIYESHRLWPTLEFAPRLNSGAAMLFLELLDRVMRIAFLLAGPVMIAMFLGELALALVTRFAPQLNVFDLSLAIKSLIFILTLPVYAMFLVDHLSGTIPTLRRALDELAGFLG